MRLASLPDHTRTSDPAWKALYDAYEPLITPLRRRQLVTDIDTCGGSTVIYAQLPDGAHLTISTGAEEGALPSSIDSVTSWLVVRESDDNPTVREVLYDSAPEPDGYYAQAGALIAPLLVAVDAFLGARNMPGAPGGHEAVVTVTTVHETGPAGFAASEVFADGTAAGHKHSALVSALGRDGHDVAHYIVCGPWRQHVLVSADRVQVVQTTLAELVPGRRAALTCNCLFPHPQTPEEDRRVHDEVRHALNIGDAHAVYVGMMRLATAPNCPARPIGTARV
ncbi:hypothetical protein [Kitasatospora cineracea]|uniref:hypothetical protein n=1 Tax=Kitasatospora cineracea TaxID=88074 RepID=UPI00340703D2